MAKARSAKVRSAEDVIDEAISDNLWWERLCYGLVIVFGTTGVAAIVAGFMKESGTISLSGTGPIVLLWPLLRFIERVRNDNIRIRMHELALAKAKTTNEMVAILREVFNRVPTTKDASETRSEGI